MRTFFVGFLTLLLLASAAAAQVKAKKPRGAATSSASSSAAGPAEPLRSIGGELNGRTVAGQFKVGGRDVPFTFVLTRAEVIGDRVQLSGDFAIGARPSHKLQSWLVGSLATTENPWPSAGDEQPQEKPKEEAKAAEQKQGREAKNPETTGQMSQLAQSTQDTARKTPAAPAARNEQTQSLYAQAQEELGCGAYYLTMAVPAQLRTAMGAGSQPVQMNVVLATLDNSRGEQISRLLCRVHRRLNNRSASDNPSGNLEKLNRLLNPGK